jgi:RHS repeat-associated protein
MRSLGRMAAYATLVLVTAWPHGSVAQSNPPSPCTATQAPVGTRTSCFAYEGNTGLLIQEVIEPNTPSLLLQADYTYDSFGNKTQIMVSGVDIATRSSSTIYDAQGQFVVQKANALQQKEFWVYDPKFGNPTSHTGPNGLTTTWSYDAFGRKTKETRADGTQTTWAYIQCTPNSGCVANEAYYALATPLDGNGNQNGPHATLAFDSLDREIYRLTQGFDGSWIAVQTVYDSLGRVKTKSRPYFWTGGTPQLTTYTYDGLSRVITESLPDGHTIKRAYHGLVTTDTNQNNQTRTVTKNSQGQVIAVADALGNVTTYYYDPFGNLVQTIDATGKNVVTASYDLRGRKTGSNDPDLGIWTYAYDVLSELKTQTDAKSQTAHFNYDVLGRLSERDEPDMISCWTYDSAQYGIGKLASATTYNGVNCQDPQRTTVYQRSITYENLGRPQQVTTTIDGVNYTISGAYDTNGRLISVTYPSQSSFAVNYGYNNLGYVTNLTDAASNQVYWTANERDAELHLTQDTAGNGVMTARGFDAPTGRLTSIVASGNNNSVASFAYTYDGLGNLLSRADANANVSEAFGYDALNRLTSSSVTAGGDPISKFFSYDSLGNLLMKSDVGNYAYPEAGLARPHGVLSIDGDAITATFSYDANGNQTAATGLGRTIAYNSYNKPATITQGSLTLAFTDDVDHQRFKQTMMAGAAVTTTRYLDAFGVHVEIVTAATTQWNDYLMVGGSMVGLRALRSDGTVSVRYFHQDHLGSIAAITDETANPANTERDAYDPWGKRRFWNNGNDDPAGSLANSSQTSRGFTGQEMLASVGLVHLNGRVYDPYFGGMTSPDPVVGDPLNGQTWNRYSYVGNNPLAFTDPTGYCFLCGIATFFERVFSGIQHFLQANPWIGSIIKIAVTAACVAAGDVCAPLVPLVALGTSVAIAGVTSGTLTGALQAGAIAIFTMGVDFAIGSIASGIPGLDGLPSFLQPANLFKDVAHALVGCVQFVMSGGRCGAGALAGAIPAIAASLPLYGSLDWTGRLVFKSVLGGLGSVAGGGKFANGAVTGAFQYLFNDSQHGINQVDVGNDAHRTLENYAGQFPDIFTEAYGDSLGASFGGRVDIGDFATGELWDIKPNNAMGIFAGTVQVEYYSIVANATGPNEYQPGGVPGFMGSTITLPGQYGTYTYTYVGDGVITYQSQLYPEFTLAPGSIPRIVPIPGPAPILRLIPVLP